MFVRFPATHDIYMYILNEEVAFFEKKRNGNYSIDF